MSHQSLVRELDAQQLAAVLAFFDRSAYLPIFIDDLAGAPLRVPEPSPEIERRLIAFEQASSSAAGPGRAGPSGVTTLEAAGQLREYTRLFGDRMSASVLRRQPLGDLQLPSIPFHFLSQWNAANPSLPVRVPVSLQEWTLIDARGVPEFFVLKDGKLAGRLRGGWPEEGNKAALLALLDGAQAPLARP